MRIAINTRRNRRNTNLLQRPNSTGLRLLLVQIQMLLNGFDKLLANRQKRIERREGVLKNHSDFLATQPAHFVGFFGVYRIG